MALKTFALVFLFVSGAFAVDRKAYVIEAASEISFYFEFLNEQPAFVENLSKPEAEQFAGLTKIASTLAARGGPRLKFSAKAEDFILNPGEPERSAKTTELLEDDIFFNLRKLNDPEVKLKYLDVVQLLVHELGHKLGAAKIQMAVDTLGSKMATSLSAYEKIETLWFSKSEHRLLSEYYESLFLPKATSRANIEPSVFFVTRKGAHKMKFWLKEKLSPADAGTVIQVSQVVGWLPQKETELRYSLYRSVKSPFGDQLVFENAYRIQTNILLDYNGIIDKEILYDKNFEFLKPRWVRAGSNFEFQVLDVKQIAAENQIIQWDVRFKGQKDPKNIYLLIGDDTMNSPWGCELISTNDQESMARCSYRVPAVTCASTLEVFQLMVDGQVADLPELLEIDLERMRVPYVLADIKPLKFSPGAENGRTFYDLTVTSPQPFISVVVRCREKKKFEGADDVFYFPVIEQIFLRHQLPIKSQADESTVFRVSCESEAGQLEEIVVTDETGYPMSPRWK